MGIKPNQLDPSPNVINAQVTAPVTGASKGAFYPKSVLGVVEGFYVDDLGREIQITKGGATSGEANTIASVGGGASLYKEKSGSELRLKTLVAGANVTLTPGVDTVTIAATDTGESNTGSTEGTGVGVFIGKAGVNLRFRSILAGANCTVTQTGQDIVIASTGGGGGGSGEANTASNLGATGARVFSVKSGVDLQFRRLIAGAGMTITENTNDVTFVASAGVGEANTVSNVGSGTGQIFKQKAGVDFELKRLLAGSGISITDGASDITITNTGGGGGGEANTASNSGAGTGIGVFKAKSGVDLVFRTIKASTGISVALSGDDVVITNTIADTGEVNTASNVGTGVGTIFKQKTGVDLELRKIKAGTNVTVSLVSDDIVIDATGSGHLTQWLTFDSGNVRIKVSGSSADIAAVTATKDFSVASVSRLIVNRPTSVQYHSIYVSFTAAETAGRTECRIEQPDPNGATTLTTALRPLGVRYNPATAGVGATTSTVSITGSTVVVATTGHTASVEQQMAVYN